MRAATFGSGCHQQTPFVHHTPLHSFSDTLEKQPFYRGTNTFPVYSVLVQYLMLFELTEKLALEMGLGLPT